jgi:hypothetical protein
MAVTSGTISSIDFVTPTGARFNGSNNQVMGCFLTATFSGTYDQGADSQILTVTTAIQNKRRDGKTVTLLDAAFAAPGDEAGTVIGAKTLAVSGSGLTMELTQSDLSTEHSAAALGSFNVPIAFFVTFVLS